MTSTPLAHDVHLAVGRIAGHTFEIAADVAHAQQLSFRADLRDVPLVADDEETLAERMVGDSGRLGEVGSGHSSTFASVEADSRAVPSVSATIARDTTDSGDTNTATVLRK
jgi:hypothetical protein